MSLLRLRSVAKSYPRGSRTAIVLRDASLEVEPGSLVSVYGSRGTGKTTLLRIAAGFERPDGGEIAIAGRVVAGLSQRQLLALRRDTVGWVGRDGPHDRLLTMAAYIALPLYRELGRRRAHLEAVRALAAVDAEQHVGDRWDDLSDASRMLCAIAQAMVRKPRLLIADDPTAGLGLLDRERICQILKAAAEEDGAGVLIAVPDMPATLRSDKTRALVRGRLLAPAVRTSYADAEIIDLNARRSA